MKEIDFDNLFIYMSLIFAFCIFIVILYGCAFQEKTQIYESFLNDDDKGDIKTQVLSLLKDLESNDATSSENKKEIKETIEKINNSSISISELRKTITLLKEMAPKKAPKKDTNTSSSTSGSSNSSSDSSSTTPPSSTSSTTPPTSSSSTSSSAPSPPPSSSSSPPPPPTAPQ
jgi:TolA-binding protein